MLHFQPTSTSIHARFRDYLKQPGFSLHDLMITLCVTSVLGVFAISTTGLVQETRMTAAVNQLMGTLSLARSEAIKRSAMVVLCKSNDGTTCSDEAAWKSGWIVFADEDNNHEVNTNEPLISVQQALEGNMSLRYGETGTYSYVRYNATGEAWPGATFTFCDGRGAEKAKAVIVFWSGRPRVSTKTSEGKPLQCI